VTQSTSCNNWQYDMVHDESDELVGVIFHRWPGGKMRRISFIHDGAALDWAALSHAGFFAKYEARAKKVLAARMSVWELVA
jgi:hypothetical protein